MNRSVEELTPKLEQILGGHAVRIDEAGRDAFSIGGQRPALVCAPSSPMELSAAVRVCAEAEATITPWGGGTAMHIGNPPRRFDVALALSRFDGLVEHDDANLTATVQAGMSLAGVHDMVSPRRQFLPVDVPFPERATVGGMIAANLNGPRRSCYGSVRDLVIGLKAVLATGEEIKAGGKVVKNVAGYDLCKLFVGSFGTLGIITQATLRMSPLPNVTETLITSGTPAQLFKLADEIAHSPLLPAALVLLDSRASSGGRADQKFQLALWAEGFHDAVARHLQEAQAMADRAGLHSESLEHSAHIRFWNEIRDFPLAANRCVMRVTVPRGALAATLKSIDGGPAANFEPTIVADVLAGGIWIAVAANDNTLEHLVRLGAVAREHGGHAVVLAAPAEVKENLDVWGGTPTAFRLMRELKRQFDPQGLLNPGRFVGGI